MASSPGHRFMVLLLVLYLATTAFFLLFIQHTSERHLTASHSGRSPLLLRRAKIAGRPPQPWDQLAAAGVHKQSSSARRSGAGEQTAELWQLPDVKVAEKKTWRSVPAAKKEGGNQAPGSRRPLILFLTPLWGQLDNWSRFFSVSRLGGCQARCSFTSQKHRLDEAALVLFSAADLHHLTPTGTGRSQRLPRQLWALFALDPPPAETRLRPQQLDRLFNWTISYRSDADVQLLYGRAAPLAGTDRAAALRMSEGRRALFRPQLCRTHSRREEYVRELGQHMDVDVVGPCGNVTCGAAPQCLSTHAGNHTFYLALEAADCPDFVTARLHQALRHGLIPVVRGGADYTRIAPPDSFVDAAAFRSAAALARHLRTMSDGQVRRHHRWRTTHRLLPTGWACELCTKLHRLITTGKEAPAHGGQQLVRWWERGRCHQDGLHT